MITCNCGSQFKDIRGFNCHKRLKHPDATVIPPQHHDNSQPTNQSSTPVPMLENVTPVAIQRASPVFSPSTPELEQLDREQLLQLYQSKKRAAPTPKILDEVIMNRTAEVAAAEQLLEVGPTKRAFRYLTSHGEPATVYDGHIYLEDKRAGGKYVYHYCQARNEYVIIVF